MNQNRDNSHRRNFEDDFDLQDSQSDNINDHVDLYNFQGTSSDNIGNRESTQNSEFGNNSPPANFQRSDSGSQPFTSIFSSNNQMNEVVVAGNEEINIHQEPIPEISPINQTAIESVYNAIVLN